MKKKTVLMVIGGIVLGILLMKGIEMYKEYQYTRELENEIRDIEAELDKLDLGNYSFIESGDFTSNLSLTNFSANSDGTFVKAYGSITNNSSQIIDEIGEIAFFNSDGSLNRVKSIMVELGAGETLHFEELIGLTKDGTQVPSSAELTGF